MLAFLKKITSLGKSGVESIADAESTKKEADVEKYPKIMTFCEVSEPSNRVGDIFWLPSEESTTKKTLAVNFDFEICGWNGE